MKKLLSILRIITMITGSSTMAVACGCVPTKNEPEYSSFYSMQISNTTLKNVLIKSNEVIYATSENHVYQINPKNHTFIKLGKTPLPDYEITGLLIGKNEELYIIAGIINNKSEHQVAGNIYKYNSMTDMFEEILTGNMIDGGYIYSSVFNNNKDMMYISINPAVKKWELWQIKLAAIDDSKEIGGVDQSFQMDNIINRNNTIYANDKQHLYVKKPVDNEFSQIALNISLAATDQLKLLNIDQAKQNLYFVAEINSENILYQSTDDTTFNMTEIKVPWSVEAIKIVNDIVYLVDNDGQAYQGKVTDNFDNFIMINELDMSSINNLDVKDNLMGFGTLTGIFYWKEIN